MKKALLLPAFLGATLSGIYFLPKAGVVAESAIKMELPEKAASWQFNTRPPSAEELQALSRDTQFSKSVCLRARPDEYSMDGKPIPDRIDLSVVLSGSDLNNSIHRPERCMPAQGHTILSSSDQTLKLKNGREFKARRLVSVQSVATKDEQGRDTYAKFNCVTYYFFVGHDQITNDHLGRTIIDMKDRLLKGMDQRWAYVTTSMWHGEIPWMEGKKVPIEEADSKLQNFLTNFAETQIKWDQLK